MKAGAVHAVHQIDLETSLVSTRCRLWINYTGDAAGDWLPRSLFLKISNPAFPHNDDLPVDFYNRLVLQMAARWSGDWPFVTCVDAAWSAGTKAYHLLLEDLSETHATTKTGAPPSHHLGEQLIEAYARLHAFWWEHPDLGWTVGSFLTHQAIDGFETGIQAQLNHLVQNDDADLTADEIAFLRRLPVFWPQRRRERIVAGEQVTIVHRDPHPGNVLFPRVPNSHTVKLIDWQSWRVDPGTDDLAYLMAFHWPVETRAELEELLLRHYHARLAALGVRDYTWDDCLYDYRASILRFLGIMVLYWQQPANRERLKRGIQAAIDWNCLFIL